MQVRKLIGAGEAEQAVELCSEVTETLIAELLSNKEAYADYVSGWELQRKHAVSEAPMDVSYTAQTAVCTCCCVVCAVNAVAVNTFSSQSV